jgi:hypothetical protein
MTHDDEYEEPYEDDIDYDCLHEEAEVDLLTGEMTCRCGYHRFLSGDELRREAELQAEMMEAYYRECKQTEQDAKAAT